MKSKQLRAQWLAYKAAHAAVFSMVVPEDPVVILFGTDEVKLDWMHFRIKFKTGVPGWLGLGSTLTRHVDFEWVAVINAGDAKLRIVMDDKPLFESNIPLGLLSKQGVLISIPGSLMHGEARG